VNSLIVVFVSFEAVVFAIDDGFERISDLLLECLFDSICGLHYVFMLGINYKSLIVELIQIQLKSSLIKQFYHEQLDYIN